MTAPTKITTAMVRFLTPLFPALAIAHHYTWGFDPATSIVTVTDRQWHIHPDKQNPPEIDVVRRFAVALDDNGDITEYTELT